MTPAADDPLARWRALNGAQQRALHALARWAREWPGEWAATGTLPGPRPGDPRVPFPWPLAQVLARHQLVVLDVRRATVEQGCGLFGRQGGVRHRRVATVYARLTPLGHAVAAQGAKPNGRRRGDGAVTLYRATASERPRFGPRTSWSESPDAADAYTRNPGFGGDTVFAATLRPSYVLDLTAGRPYHVSEYGAQYDRLRAALEESDAWPALQARLGWYGRAPERYLGDFIHNLWEEDAGVFQALADLYGWVVFYDDFPEGSVTWTKLDDAPLDETPRAYKPNRPPDPSRDGRVAALHRNFGLARAAFAARFPGSPAARATLVIDPRGCLGGRVCASRDLAEASWSGARGPEVRLVARALRLPAANLWGLLLHELGHLADPDPDAPGAERRADALAQKATGRHLYYDAHDVQTVDPRAPGAQRVRPPHLHT